MHADERALEWRSVGFATADDHADFMTSMPMMPPTHAMDEQTSNGQSDFNKRFTIWFARWVSLEGQADFGQLGLLLTILLATDRPTACPQT